MAGRVVESGAPENRRRIRPTAVAGQFYPSDPEGCRTLAAQYLAAAPVAGGETAWLGGIVPHAGWICSGAIAGRTIAALREGRASPDVVVVFGAVHTALALDAAALDSHQMWASPGGDVAVPLEIEEKLFEGAAGLFVLDERFHEREHAVEVEVPLIRQAWPQAAVLPIEVPAIELAIAIGAATARQLSAAGLSAVYLASSDLTHYGPDYGFVPAGVGEAGLEWAKQNDRRLLRAVSDFSPERIVPEVRQRLNACGGGAIAAMMSACREMGARRGLVLQHANSFETLARVASQPAVNAVGYAAVVVG